MGPPFLAILETWKLMGPRDHLFQPFHCVGKESETYMEDVAHPGSQSSLTKEQKTILVATALQPEWIPLFQAERPHPITG